MGDDVFTYTVTDGTSATTSTLTITIYVNSAPSATVDTGYIQEGKTLTVADGASANDADSSSNNNDATGDHTGDVLGNDTDANSDTLTVTTYEHTSSAGQGGANTTPGSPASGTAGTDSVAGTYGTLDLEANGSYTYTANSNITNLDTDDETFTDVFTYTVSDGNGGTDTATITITIEASAAPTARNDTGSVNEDATLTVSDGDNATSVTGVSQDTGSPYAISEGTVRSVAFNDDGTKMFVVHAANGTPKISEHALTTAFDINTASQSTTYNISSHLTEPRGIRFNNDGTKLYISSGANANKKIYEFSLSTAYDVSSLPTATETSISGQDSGPRGFSFNADGTKMFLIGDTNNAVYEYSLSTAFDTTTISYTNRSLDISAKEVTPRGLSFNPTGTKLYITGQNSDDILEYDLSTGFNLSTATFNGAFSLTGFATKPNDVVFNNDGTKAFIARANNNGVLSFSLSSPYSFVDITGEHSGDVINTSNTNTYDTDPDSDTLTVTAIRTGSDEGNGTAGSVGSALTGTYGDLTIAANGSYTYVANNNTTDALDAGDIVTDTFNYTVSDGQGETDIATITITITGINDAPSAVADTDSVDAGSTVTDTTNSAGTLVSDDTDPDASSSLYITQVTPSGGSATSITYNSTKTSNAATITGSKGTLTIGSDGSYSYAANSNASSGNDVFTYTLTDGTSTTTSTLTITINNNAPSAVADTGYIQEGKTLTVADGASANDADSSSNNNDATGDHTGDVLENDTDADSDSLIVTTYTHTSSAGQAGADTTPDSLDNGTAGAYTVSGTYGTLDLEANGSYVYTANSNITNLDTDDETFTDVFTYTVSDGEDTHTATITITIEASAAPTARNDTGSVNEDATLTVSDGDNATSDHSGDVINTSNTNTYDTDPDSDTLTVTAIRTGSDEGNGTAGSVGSALTGTYGDLTIAANGSYTYVANNNTTDALDAGDIVTDVFNYTVSDGQGETDIATITITITGINDAPTAVADTDSVDAGSTVTDTTNSAGTLVSDDTDPDASASLYITQVTPSGGSATSITYNSTKTSNAATITGSKGTLTIGSDGSYSYAANSNASSGNDVFTYTLTDGTSTTTSTLTISVSVNNAPVAQDDTGTVNEDATLTVANSSNATSATAATFANPNSDGSGVDVSGQESSPRHIAFNDDGTKMFISGNGTNKVYEYNLSTAYDTSTAVYSNNSVSLSGQDNSPLSLTFNNDGTKMFVLGTQNDSIYEYTLSVGFDLSSSVTYTNNSVSVSTQESTPIDVTFNNDGTKMFVTGWTNDTIFEYTVSTGFDLSNVSYSNNSYSISSQENYPTDIKFNNDGTKMFAIGIDGDDVNEYTLSSPFDLTSTITHLGSFDISSQETFPYGLEFNNDGTKMYVVGVDGDDVNEYTLASPFSLINVTGEHSGDVIDTSSSSNSDSDADVGDTLTVTNISHSNTNTDTVESGSTYSDSGGEPGSIAGTYGTITIGADGSYQYVADLDATDALDAGDIVTDTFTYTVSDGAATDTADIVITVVGINDAPTAVADTDSVDAGSTVTDTTNSAGTLVSDDTDPDASSSLYITQVTPSNGSATSITYNSTKTSNAATITGSKGTLTIGSDGSYSYAANSNASSGNDVFTYTLTDGTSTTTSTLTISVTEINNAPTASNNTVTTNEDTDHTFAASEFGFTDVDGDSLDHVTIETLPSNGTLLLSGSAVSAGDEISAANITNLVFRPAANANGSGYGSFTFSVNDGTVIVLVLTQ